jgi:chromosome partitioning protein
MPEIICVANQKGGVGKTTTAVNLAAALAISGKKTILIDLDPQGNATSALGFDKNDFAPNIYNVLVDLVPLDKTIKETEIAGLAVSGSNVHLVGAETELVEAVARESRLKGALSHLKAACDYVIIDCPPTLGLLTLNALVASDKVLIPVQGEYYAMEGLAQLMETIQRVKESVNEDLGIEGGVLTMFDPRMTLSQQVREEVGKFFGESLFKTIIPRNIRLAEAPGFAQTIFQYDAQSRGAAAYRELAAEFLSRRSAPISQPSPPRGEGEAPSSTAPSPPNLADKDIKERVPSGGETQ